MFKKAKALDVCCGTADWTSALADAAGEQGEVKGLDFSKNMLSVGETKVKTGGYNQIELIHGNAMELPLRITRLIMSQSVLAFEMSLIT